MAKLGLILSNERKIKCVQKYANIRKELKAQIIASDDIYEKSALIRKLDQLPKNGSPVRVRNRCSLTGRPRGVDKRTGVCRMIFRNMASEGLLPGFVKGK